MVTSKVWKRVNSEKTKGSIHQSYLSLFLTPQAGIIDDTIITKFPDSFHLVVNGANKHKVIQHFLKVKND